MMFTDPNIGKTMVISCSFICALLINTCIADIVYSQDTVVGVIGENVTLPCNSNKNEHNLQEISVLWRHNGSINVYIIKQVGSVEDQEPQEQKYGNRTETFPKEYEKGNFSLIIHNLTHTDAGEYQCYITHSLEVVAVMLLINETMNKKQTAEKGNKAEETRRLWISVPVLCIFVIIFLIIFLSIVFRLKKMGYKSSSAGSDAAASSVGLRHNSDL